MAIQKILLIDVLSCSFKQNSYSMSKFNVVAFNVALFSMFHQQLILLREIFQKNGYPENFIDRCFKSFLNKIHILKEKVPTVEKKPLQFADFLI